MSLHNERFAQREAAGQTSFCKVCVEQVNLLTWFPKSREMNTFTSPGEVRLSHAHPERSFILTWPGSDHVFSLSVFTTRKNSWPPAGDYLQQTANPCCKSSWKLQFIDFFFSELSKFAHRQGNLDSVSMQTESLPPLVWKGRHGLFASDFKTRFLNWSTRFESNFLLFLPNWMPFSARNWFKFQKQTWKEGAVRDVCFVFLSKAASPPRANIP